MTIKYYPDGLPFGLIERFGLPFHGIVKDGALTLPDASTMTYPQPAGTDITYVKHPLGAVPVRTPEEIAWDAARNYQWLDHAYLSGYYRSIGGVDFSRESGSPTTDYWLYCSATKAWLIRATRQTLTGKVRVTLAARRFGDFGIPTNLDAETFVDIGAHEFIVKDYENNNVTNSGGASIVFMGSTHKKDGSVSVINFRFVPFSTSYFDASFNFCGAIQLTVTGDTEDELSVSGSDLCFGSQIASVEEFSEGETNHIQISVFDDGTWTYGTYDPFYTWRHEEITDRAFDLGPPRFCSAQSTVTFDSEGTPTFVRYGWSYSAETKVYYFITPDGVVDHFVSEYRNMSETNYNLNVGWMQVSGSVTSIGAVITEQSPPQVVTSDSSRTVERGTEVFVGLASSTLFDMSEKYEEVGVSSATRTFEWKQPCDDYQVAVDGSNFLGGSTTYQITTVGETTEYEEPPSFVEKTALLTIHNNNVIDAWRVDGSNVRTYSASMTIFGEKFSRMVGGNLVDAVVDPRTGTVVLADTSAQSISIV